MTEKQRLFKKLVSMGYYREKPIYYNLEDNSFYESQGNEIPKWMTGASFLGILIAIPCIRLVDSWNIFNLNIVKLLILIISTVLVFFAVNFFNKSQYNDLKINPVNFNLEEYKLFLEQSIKNNKVIVVTWLLSAIGTILGIIYFILTSSSLFLLVYIVLFFACMLMSTNNLHKRIQIVNKLNKEKD